VLLAVVGIDGGTGTSPDSVRALQCIESPSLRGLPKGVDREHTIGQRCERHESRWSGNVWHYEAVEVVNHCPSNDFSQSPVIVSVSFLERY
jgi:hypothetical protein